MFFLLEYSLERSNFQGQNGHVVTNPTFPAFKKCCGVPDIVQERLEATRTRGQAFRRLQHLMPCQGPRRTEEAGDGCNGSRGIGTVA